MRYETTEVSVMANLFNKNNQYFLITGLISILVILSIGCSNGVSPMEPAVNMPNADDIPFRTNNLKSGEFVLGAYDLYISPDLQSAEILPIRTLDDVGDSWFLEMTKFFIARPCVDCLTITGVSITDENWVKLDIHVKHPFEQGNLANPPDSRNRDDVRIFDAKLIVIDKDGDGIEFTGLGKTLSSNILINADGYTDMIEPVYDPIGNRPNDTHPYKILFENALEGNVDPMASTGFTDLSIASGHNVMNQGGSDDTFLLLDITNGETIPLRLYLTGNYGQSATDYTDRLAPSYYLPEFNAKEAWKVEAFVESNSLGPGYTESMADIMVKVWDWQQGAIIDSGLNALNKIRSASDVAEVILEVPDLFSGTLSTIEYELGGTGQSTTPLVYHFEAYNEKAAIVGVYDALVCVLDEREIGGNVSTSEDGIRNSGFGLVEFDIPGFRTYQYLSIAVSAMQNIRPIAKFTTSPSGNPAYIGLNEDINYDASDSDDVDGEIASYEWDFDYDGVTFNPESGHTSAFGAFQYSVPGTYKMALRVEDNTIPIMNDITYKYVIVMDDPSNIDARLILPIGADCGSLHYGAHNPIRCDGLNVYIPLSGEANGVRYILGSDDYGAVFSEPIQISYGQESPYNEHIGGFDYSSTSELSCLFFDHTIMSPDSVWMMLSRATDISTWYPVESLRDNTTGIHVTNGDMIYGADDRLFLFFETLDFESTYGKSNLNYFHREFPYQVFQDEPIVIDTSDLSPNLSRFLKFSSAVDDSGNIHLAYSKMRVPPLPIDDDHDTFYCRIAPDGESITREPVQVNPDTPDFCEKWVALAVDENKVYIAYHYYDKSLFVVDLMLVVSHDNGENWGTPAVISDASYEGAWIDHSINIAVDHNHRIHFVWTNNRYAEIGYFNNIWYDYTDDFGQSYHEDLQLYGDDILGKQEDPGIAIDDIGRVHVVWWNNDIDAGQGIWHTRFVN